MILTIPTASVFASEDITSHNKMNRPAINPDFDPDESRNFDVEQPKCIPGSEQDRPEGFGENEDSAM